MRYVLSLRPISVLLILCFLSGCASLPGRRSSSAKDDVRALEVASFLRFDDIPVPYGFKIQPEESFAFQNDFSRVGLLRYTGKTSADSLVLFYKEQMPLYNWRMVNIIEFGRRVLNFEKEDQNCIVMIESGKTKTGLILAIAPKATIRASSIIKPLKKGE
ncbi:MAG: hypothetical protein JW844_02545 [Candidatus Omnitrophica bacterium]|nr:hypothetical protein [Candidatus Omnitrophota bacterium]